MLGFLYQDKESEREKEPTFIHGDREEFRWLSPNLSLLCLEEKGKKFFVEPLERTYSAIKMLHFDGW